MGIKELMMTDIKEAMKSGDTAKRDALRTLHSALKQVEIDKRIVLSDDDCIGILKTALKQREDAKNSYINAQRHDLADKEEYEISLIMQYLPVATLFRLFASLITLPKSLESFAPILSTIPLIAVSNSLSLSCLGKYCIIRLNNVATGKRISDVAKKLLQS